MNSEHLLPSPGWSVYKMSWGTCKQNFCRNSSHLQEEISFTVKFKNSEKITLGFINKTTQGPETEGMSPVSRLPEVPIASFTLGFTVRGSGSDFHINLPLSFHSCEWTFAAPGPPKSSSLLAYSKSPQEVFFILKAVVGGWGDNLPYLLLQG